MRQETVIIRHGTSWTAVICGWLAAVGMAAMVTTIVSAQINSERINTSSAVSAAPVLIDGTFAPSTITVDLNGLASDSRQRDQYVKQTTLQTSRFATATFVPTRTTGLTLPLPAAGEFAFTLYGTLTIRGVSREVTFDVRARRDGRTLTASAIAAPSWKFADFGPATPQAASVLSVVDEIRLDFEIVATGA